MRFIVLVTISTRSQDAKIILPVREETSQERLHQCAETVVVAMACGYRVQHCLKKQSLENNSLHIVPSCLPTDLMVFGLYDTLPYTSN